MILSKTILRCKLFITNIPLQTIRRPCSRTNVLKMRERDPCSETCKPDGKDTKIERDPCAEPYKPDGKDTKIERDPCAEPYKPEGKDTTEKGSGGLDQKGGLPSHTGAGFDLQEKTRPVRLAVPGKVRFGLIPDEWFDFFYQKTGVTGPYIFLVAVGTYLISKEKYVMEHEYYTLLSVAVLTVATVKNVGPMLARYLDKEIDEYERLWNQQRVEERAMLEESIYEEQRLQISSEGQILLINAKRENVILQLEAAYRDRFVYVQNEVKNRLDYHVQVEYIHHRLIHKNLVDWVVAEVIKSYADKQDAHIEACIDELATIAARENKQ